MWIVNKKTTYGEYIRPPVYTLHTYPQQRERCLRRPVAVRSSANVGESTRTGGAYRYSETIHIEFAKTKPLLRKPLHSSIQNAALSGQARHI